MAKLTQRLANEIKSMNLTSIPRGRLYHSLASSAKYFLQALVFYRKELNLLPEAEKKFAAYVGCKYAVAFPLARTAVYFSLLKANCKPGDEVILSPVSIKGMLEVIMSLGLVPKFLDYSKTNTTFLPSELDLAISSRTKACLITPLFGSVSGLEEISDVLKKKGIFSILDFSQCLNGQIDGNPITNLFDVAIYSSSSLKTLDTFGGGLLVTNSKSSFEFLKIRQDTLTEARKSTLVRKSFINLVRNIAIQPLVFSILTFWYLRAINLLSPGRALKQTGRRSSKLLKKLPSSWFCSYSDFQCKVLLEQLGRVSAWDSFRYDRVYRLTSGIPNQEAFLSVNEKNPGVFWQLIYRADDALRFQQHMAKAGIDVCTTSLSFLPELIGQEEQDFPNAINLYRNGIFIPHVSIRSEKQFLRVQNAVSEYKIVYEK